LAFLFIFSGLMKFVLIFQLVPPVSGRHPRRGRPVEATGKSEFNRAGDGEDKRRFPRAGLPCKLTCVIWAVASPLCLEGPNLTASVILLRKAIDPAASYPSDWPQGIVGVEFEPEQHARAARELLNTAYAPGGGNVLSFQDWWPALAGDAEYRPDLCFVALDAASGAMAGFAQCWSLGFIKDIAIAPAWRRHGLGKALMQAIFTRFQQRGIYAIDLKVTADNPSGAGAFYRALGMVEVSRQPSE
jgi:ribosomal protein S18 acetylase RimI-like enzyme